MSENEKPRKTWIMFKKSYKETEFNECPWINCNWVDGDPTYKFAYGTGDLGTFTATTSATACYGINYGNYAYSYLRQAFNENNYSSVVIGVPKNVEVEDIPSEMAIYLELPEGVFICPKKLYVEKANVNKRGNHWFKIQGYNPVTKSWELLYETTKQVTAVEDSFGSEFIKKLTASCNTNNFYSKFSWTTSWSKSVLNYCAAWDSLRIDSGILKTRK